MLLSLLVASLLAMTATGGAAAASPVDSCDGNTTTIVGGVGDTVFNDTVTLYPGSTLTVEYCPSGEPANSDWLESGDGFELDNDTGNSSTYTVTITDSAETIKFSEYLVSGNQSSVETEVKITVADSAATDGGTERLSKYQAFLEAVSETNNATATLNETTVALSSGQITEEKISETNTSVSSLENKRKNLRKSRSNLLAELQSARANGADISVVATAKTVDSKYAAADTSATTEAERYTEAIESRTAASRSTVRLSVFGSLGVGVILGVVGGAVVPLIAARRAREKMRLSRDVGVDLKTAILPTLLGLVVGLIGLAILIRIGITDLLWVIV